MKKSFFLTAILLVAAGNVVTTVFAQENIRAMISNFENMGVKEMDIIRNNYPIIKKINRSTTSIQIASSPDLEQQIENAFRQDSENAIHAIEQKKDGKVYMFFRYKSSTYSYTSSNDIINMIESNETKHRIGLYSFFFNVVPDDFRFPLIGFVNTAIGSHQGLQAGFVNTTLVDFRGAQIGFVNSTLNDFSGLQAGFFNMTINELKGAQVGFVNTAGFGQQQGAQVGFVNLMRKGIKGVQVGFVNITGGGVQGSQIGFLNYADSITGVPIGFISIVKKGGYRALEVSANEWYPVNLSFKIGVPRLYSFVSGSYNNNFENQFAIGYGLGSLLPLSKKLYFNPEFSNTQPIGKDFQLQFHSFVGNIGYQLSPHLQIAAGPSVTHVYSDKSDYFYKPAYSIVNHQINSHNRLVVGARIALGVNF